MSNSWKKQDPAGGGRSERPSEAEVATREFTASGPSGSLLRLLSMDADTVITSDPAAGAITVTVTGQRSRIESLLVDNTDGLSITSQRPVTDIFMSVNGMSVWELFKGLFTGRTLEQIAVIDRVRRLKIVATVPAGTHLSLADYAGSLQADGVCGEVDASVVYDTRLRLGRVSMLNVRGDSGLDVTVDSVYGNATVKATYDATIKILDGDMARCDLHTDMGANVLVKATTAEMTAKGSYNCTFSLGTVTGVLRATADSGGRITFHCDDANQVDVRTSYDGDVTATGATRRAILCTGSGCNVTLGAVTDRITAGCEYDCTLTTTEGQGTDYVDIKMGDGADVQLIGLISAGTITTGYDSSVCVGALGSGVRTRVGNNTQITTGYGT